MVEAEDSDQRDVDLSEFVKAEPPGELPQTAGINGRSLLDKHTGRPAVEFEFRPETGWPGAGRGRSYEQGGEWKVIGLQNDRVAGSVLLVATGFPRGP